MNMSMNNDNFLDSLNWRVNCRDGKSSIKNFADVSISLTVCKGKVFILITFRNDWIHKFPSEHVAFAVSDNRMYCKDDLAGLKLYGVDNCSCRYLKFSKDLNIYRSFVGDYTLQYDPVYELYYIERENVK